MRPLGGEGYDWLLERARELRGDLMRILAVRPPERSSMAFEQEFQSACMDLVDALVPEGVEIHAYLAEHVPDAADALAVERLAAAPRGRRTSIR